MDAPAGRRTLLVAVVAALAASPPAAAQQPLEVRGVRAENAPSGGVTITFGPRAAALYRRIAGLRTIVRCQTATGQAGALLIPLDRAAELFQDAKAPQARRPLRIRHPAGTTFDVCELTTLRSRGRGAKRTFKAVLSLALPLTPAGAAYLEARRAGQRLIAILSLTASLGQDGAYPAVADVANVVPRLTALAAPGDAPPPGGYGLYSDGAQHVAVVATTASGLRLFIDADAGTLTSNVPGLVLGRR